MKVWPPFYVQSLSLHIHSGFRRGQSESPFLPERPDRPTNFAPGRPGEGQKGQKTPKPQNSLDIPKPCALIGGDRLPEVKCELLMKGSSDKKDA